MATVAEMKSRWVYSELTAPKWRRAYARLRGNTPLLEKARLHVPFASLAPNERDQLLKYAPSSSRRGLMGRLSNHAAYHFELWNKMQISATRTTQAYGSLPYNEFLSAHCKSGKHVTAAREVAPRLYYNPGNLEGGMVVGRPGDYMLLDGYMKSVAFMRDAPPGAKFPMWVPDE